MTKSGIVVSLKKILIVGILALISAESFSQTSINWEIPFTPIKISYNRYNGISVTASAGIATPIGRFSIDYTQTLSKKRENSNITYVDRIKIQKQDLIIIIRDRNKKNEQDILYKIENGAILKVTTSGKTNIEAAEGMVIVDITDVEDCTISLQKNEANSIDRTKIETTIRNYYDNIKNNQDENLKQMFANQIQRFFNLNNVDRNIVVEQFKKYDEMFGVYGKYFNVRWNTLEISSEAGGFISLNYLLDYSIERYDKTKPSKFLIKMYITLNQNYQIVSVYENIIDK